MNNTLSHWDNMTPEQFKQYAQIVVPLYLQDWKWRFTDSRSVLGRCIYHAKTLEFSIPYILSYPHEARETLLHEIAHGIAGGHAGHGWQWQDVAVRLGAKPVACAYVGKPLKLETATQLGLLANHAVLDF
jgi:hypothetical protein